MIGGAIAKDNVGLALLPSAPGKLEQNETDALWTILEAIARTWGEEDETPIYQRSQWLEFLHVKTEEAPSYLAEYRSGLDVLAELRQMYDRDLWCQLFFAHGAAEAPASRLAHLRKFVVEEFIQVWLTSGGFKTYGAGNYNSYVSGSRFAVRPAYRRQPSSPQAPSPQTRPLA